MGGDFFSIITFSRAKCNESGDHAPLSLRALCALVRGRRSTVKRIEEGLVTPTLAATPGDLSLVLPKRILDGIIEMIYALDKIAPGTANDDTLLYGVEVKFYNMEVALDEHLETPYKGLYVIGDGSGITHSLSHASASGVYVAREILETV